MQVVTSPATQATTELPAFRHWFYRIFVYDAQGMGISMIHAIGEIAYAQIVKDFTQGQMEAPVVAAKQTLDLEEYGLLIQNCGWVEAHPTPQEYSGEKRPACHTTKQHILDFGPRFAWVDHWK